MQTKTPTPPMYTVAIVEYQNLQVRPNVPPPIRLAVYEFIRAAAANPSNNSKSDNSKPSHILTTSTLARSKTALATASPLSVSSSLSFRGSTFICTKVPGPRFLESVPGFSTRTESTTWCCVSIVRTKSPVARQWR